MEEKSVSELLDRCSRRERTQKRLKTIGPRETIDGLAGSSGALDGAAKRNNEL